MLDIVVATLNVAVISEIVLGFSRMAHSRAFCVRIYAVTRRVNMSLMIDSKAKKC